MMIRTVLAVSILLGNVICSSGAYAQIRRDPVNGNDVNNGSNVTQVLNALERTAGKTPFYKEDVDRIIGSVGVVFVPGILGSTLESPTVGKIWGFGIPDPDKLALPEDLIDPGRTSDVKAQLAESVLGVTLYGDAIRKIRASASAIGIPPERVIACGYDWRRDIRAGAVDLDNCVKNAPEFANVDAVIVIAHSMGGLVAWQWLQTQAPEGELPNGARILAVAVLGSPLMGSCEIVRMIEAGYVQPVANQEYIRGTWLTRRWNDLKSMKDNIVNATTSMFTDSIRPLVLTWPGAIDLSPRPAATREDPGVCALVPFNSRDIGDPRVLTHYMPAFWTAPIGVDILNGARLPQTYARTLVEATQFRDNFKLAPLASPTYLYASQAWQTPVHAPVSPGEDYRLAKNDWDMAPGDGRVPFIAATPSAVTAADIQPLASVHGNLPEDEDFHAFFFAERLPRVLNAWFSTQVIELVKDNPDFLKAYLADKGPLAVPSDFYTAYEPDRGAAARYAISNLSQSNAVEFNQALCNAGAKCPSYADAKLLAAAATTNLQKATIYSGSMLSGTRTGDDGTFIIAKRGLSMALNRNWAAAISDLRVAAAGLEARSKRPGIRESDNEKALRIAVYANLGRALAIRGYCGEASAPLKVGALGGNELAAKTLQAPCYDRESGKIFALNK